MKIVVSKQEANLIRLGKKQCGLVPADQIVFPGSTLEIYEKINAVKAEIFGAAEISHVLEIKVIQPYKKIHMLFIRDWQMMTDEMVSNLWQELGYESEMVFWDHFEGVEELKKITWANLLLAADAENKE